VSFFGATELLQFWISGLRAGIRGRSFLTVFVLGIFLIFVAYLSGSFSPRQPRTVALDIGLSGVRVTLVLLNIFWIQELLANEIARKSVLFSLTYPVSRTAYFLGRYLSVLAMSALATLTFGLALLIAVNLSGGYYQQDFPVQLGLPLWLALAGQFVDVAVVAAFAMFISSISSSPMMSIAAGFAFAIGGKALGATLDYLAAGADGDQKLVGTFGPLLEAIRWVLPDLSRLDWRDWPMYGVQPDTKAMVAALFMALAYVTIILGMTARTVAKREFS